MQRGFARKRGSRWTACWYTGAGSTRKQHNKGGFRTKADALAFLNTTVAAIQVGSYVEPVRLTVGQYLETRWLPMAKHNVRPSTYDSYERLVELHIVPTIGHIGLQDLTPHDLDRLYRQLLESGRKARGSAGKPLSGGCPEFRGTSVAAR